MTIRAVNFEPVRLGIVGAGEFGRQHMSTAAGLAEANLVAVVDQQEARRAAINMRFAASGNAMEAQFEYLHLREPSES